MKYRIGAWASAGVIVAAFWAFYLFPNALSLNPIVLTLAKVTCPIVYLHTSIHFYWVVLANAATYALVGMTVEMLRKPATQL
jgi:hypothetical protein